VIPGDVIDEAVRQCDATLSSSADTSPEAQKKIVDAFAAYKVTKDQIEKRIQRRIDAITPAQVVQLRKILLSMRDGMSGPEDWFESPSSSQSATPPSNAEPINPFADQGSNAQQAAQAPAGTDAPAEASHEDLANMPDAPWGESEDDGNLM
jgi:hypothetical protein